MLLSGKVGAILLAVSMSMFCHQLDAQSVISQTDFGRLTAKRAGAPTGWTFGGNVTNMYHTWTDIAQGLPIGARCSVIEANPISLTGSNIVRLVGPSTHFATVMQAISAQDYRGKRVRFSAQLSTLNVTGQAGLWMRVDGANGKILNFDDMASHQISGTTPWSRYDIVLDVPLASATIQFGYLLAGGGKVEAAQFRFEEVDASTSTTSNGVPAANEDLPKTPRNLGLRM